MTTGRILTTIIFTALGVFFGYQLNQWLTPAETGDDSSGESQVNVIDSVLAEGRILPFDGIRMATTLPGRQVAKMTLAVGDPVVVGETELCVMEDLSLLKKQWELAQSRKQDALKEINQKILSAKLNRNSAEAALEQAKLNVSRLSDDSAESNYVAKKIEVSKKKLDRIKKLSGDDQTSAFVSTQDILDQELELTKALSEKESLKKAAELGVESARKAFELATELVSAAEKAKDEMTSLNMAESIAKEQFENGKIISPISGEVLKIHTFQGDTVTSLPLMELANLEKMCVEAEVFFANLADVKIGQSVKINSPALDRSLSGKVISKSNYIGNGLLRSPNPLAMTDQETAMVKIEVNSDDVEIARRFVNLQITVEIEVR